MPPSALPPRMPTPPRKSIATRIPSAWRWAHGSSSSTSCWPVNPTSPRSNSWPLGWWHWPPPPSKLTPRRTRHAARLGLDGRRRSARCRDAGHHGAGHGSCPPRPGVDVGRAGGHRRCRPAGSCRGGPLVGGGPPPRARARRRRGRGAPRRCSCGHGRRRAGRRPPARATGSTGVRRGAASACPHSPRPGCRPGRTTWSTTGERWPSGPARSTPRSRRRSRRPRPSAAGWWSAARPGAPSSSPRSRPCRARRPASRTSPVSAAGSPPRWSTPAPRSAPSNGSEHARPRHVSRRQVGASAPRSPACSATCCAPISSSVGCSTRRSPISSRGPTSGWAS